MKTILEVLNLSDLGENPSELNELIIDESIKCKDAGDFLGAGEWLASEFEYIEEDQLEIIFCKIVTFWASPLELKVLPCSVNELVPKIEEFVAEELATAVVAASAHLLRAKHPFPFFVKDLAFRLQDTILNVFGVSTRRPDDLCKAAAAKFDAVREDLFSAIDSFINTKCVTAKVASIEVVKKCHQSKKMALAEERPIFNEIDVLLGPNFRRFCESCEEQDPSKIIKRIPDLKDQAQRLLSSQGTYANSTLWNIAVARIALHIMKLVDEATLKSEEATLLHVSS